MAWFIPYIPYAIAAAGTVASVGAAKQQTQANKQAAATNAALLEREASQSFALASRKAEEARRQADVTISRAIAVAAASGGSTTDIEPILMGLAEEGERQAQGFLYEGGEQAAGLRYRATAGIESTRRGASATMLGAYGGAAASLGGMASSAGMFGKAPTGGTATGGLKMDTSLGGTKF